MSEVRLLPVAEADGEVRLDRWFRRHFPELSHGRLEKLLRTGQVRVDGARAKASTRIAPGQTVRVPPLPAADAKPAPRPEPSSADAAFLKSCVIWQDEEIIALNKPSGLAVQGGSGVTRSVDGLLDALRNGAPDRPRLVHRLDKDTSGLLILARTANAAARLTAAFRGRDVHKLYWALVAGVPKMPAGRIDIALEKGGAPGRERMRAGIAGARAVTHYRVVDQAGRRAAWLALSPETGRTHQLRAHCAALGTPILGDGKYGGRDAFLSGVPGGKRLHLHARALALPRADGTTLTLVAPLPDDLTATWDFFGFDLKRADADRIGG